MQSLTYSAPKNRIGGRVVTKPRSINGVEVMKGDRLQPSGLLQDIGSLSSVQLPIRVKLWRANYSAEDTPKVTDAMNFRSPLFDSSIHSSPANTLAVDSLHTVSLGTAMKWASAALWRLLLGNPWKIPGTLENVTRVGAEHMKIELFQFQSDPANGIDRSRRLDGLTLKMLGKRKKKNLQDSFLDGFEQREREKERERERESER
jgi:hypothetical protein